MHRISLARIFYPLFCHKHIKLQISVKISWLSSSSLFCLPFENPVSYTRQIYVSTPKNYAVGIRSLSDIFSCQIFGMPVISFVNWFFSYFIEQFHWFSNRFLFLTNIDWFLFLFTRRVLHAQTKVNVNGSRINSFKWND